jgi:hypothetical protein
VAGRQVTGDLRAPPADPADAVRGQYDGYRDVEGVDPVSTVESFVAVRLALDSWRWAGVPILIRAGKTMPVTATEVGIRFRLVPFDVFGISRTRMHNTLRFRIWPNTEIGLALAGKKPGAGREPPMQDLVFAEDCASDMRPYDRLIGAARREPGAVRPPGQRGGRVAGRRPGARTPSPCTDTSAVPGDPRRATACCPTATTGTTRSRDPPRQRNRTASEDRVAPDDPGQTGQHRVVIVGGGFGGLFAARALRHRDVAITLVDRAQHHLFQPLLYQVATGILSEGQIAAPLRDVLKRHRNVQCVLADVVDVDVPGRRAVTAAPPMITRAP